MSPPSIVVLLLSHKKITLARLACLCFCIAVIEIHVQKLHDPLNSHKYIHVIFVSQGSSSLFFLFFFKKDARDYTSGTTNFTSS